MKNFWILMMAEVLFQLTYGIFGPIFAVFVQDIGGGNILNVGLSHLLYFGTAGIMSIIGGRISDTRKERRRFILLSAAISIPIPFVYMFVTNILQVFVLQLLNGIAGIGWGAWAAMIAESTEKGRRGLQYGYFTVIWTVIPGIAAMIGSAIVYFLGFQAMFFAMGVFNLVGFSILYNLKE